MRTLIVVLIACAGTGCGLNFGEDYTLDPSSFTAEHLETIESVARLRLPNGVRGLNMFYQGSGIDDALVAKIWVPAEGVAELADQIAAVDGAEGTASEALSEGHTWWNEDQLSEKVRREMNVESDYLELILGEVGGEWYLLVKWFST